MLGIIIHTNFGACKTCSWCSIHRWPTCYRCDKFGQEQLLAALGREAIRACDELPGIKNTRVLKAFAIANYKTFQELNNA